MSEFLRARLELLAADILRLINVRDMLGFIQLPPFSLHWPEVDDEAASPFAERLVELEEKRNRLKAAVHTTHDSGWARWHKLVSESGLKPSDEPVLALAVAPLLDPSFRLLLMQLNSTGNGYATVADALALTASRDEQLAARERFRPGSALFQKNLVSLRPDPVFPEDLLRAQLTSDRRLVDWLALGSPPDVYDPWLLLQQPERLLNQLLMPDSLKTGLQRVVKQVMESRQPAAVILHGAEGCGRKTLAAALAAEIEHVLIRVDVSQFNEAADARERMLLAVREVTLSGPAHLYVAGLADLQLEPVRNAIMRVIDRFEGLVFVAMPEQTAWVYLPTQTVYRFTVELPSSEVRSVLWDQAFREFGLTQAEMSSQDLGHRFKLTGGNIRAVSKMTAEQSWLRGRRDPILTDIQAAVVSRAPHGLGSMAERITRFLRWSDLVLPDDALNQLWDVIRHARNQRRVLDEWGFRSKLPYGTGISALFWGDPGTGKTMATSLIAQELDLDLYQIDLSRLVSKYIGETEKNIAKVFDEAKDAPAILLFDEADSLFAKRTDVKSSHDRYANLEVNYLLQRMETYDGISILTTNFEKSIDEAFRRRLAFQIEFPFPDAEMRESLWRSMFPPSVRVEKSVDFNWLAEEFELSGGFIKNVVVRAAFSAAEARPDGEAYISTDEIIDGAIAVYREMGKLYRSKKDQKGST